ncbi:MAG: hypothetical protein Q8M91_20245 [Polaromonas sp.]|nr:hypothetical protein [Polaromonas sp.]
MNLAARLISLLAFLAFHTAPGAQQVGRVEVKDLPDGWTQLVSYDMKGLSIDGGIGNIPMTGAAFSNKSLGMLLIVESTQSGYNKTVNWVSMKCPASRPHYFTNDYGANRNSRDTRCLVVNAKYADRKYLATASPQTAAAVDKEGLQFDKGQLIRTWSGVKSGSYLKLFLFKTSAFELATTAGKEEGTGVDQALIAFGESLQKLVYDSTLSMSGNLSLKLFNTIK